MSDPHWLVKDFHALYLAADTAAVALLKAPRAAEARATLMMQLSRLRPAFEICEAERQGGEAERLTPGERFALNALHRWLHSPGGDGELTEAAQPFHDQVELECPGDCERLEAEERLAWAQLRRGEVEP